MEGQSKLWAQQLEQSQGAAAAAARAEERAQQVTIGHWRSRLSDKPCKHLRGAKRYGAGHATPPCSAMHVPPN